MNLTAGGCFRACRKRVREGEGSNDRRRAGRTEDPLRVPLIMASTNARSSPGMGRGGLAVRCSGSRPGGCARICSAQSDEFLHRLAVVQEILRTAIVVGNG